MYICRMAVSQKEQDTVIVESKQHTIIKRKMYNVVICCFVVFERLVVYRSKKHYIICFVQTSYAYRHVQLFYDPVFICFLSPTSSLLAVLTFYQPMMHIHVISHVSYFIFHKSIRIYIYRR